jgi:TPR repeat protein
VNFFRASADQNFPPGQIAYAWMLEHGRGTNKNVAKAVKYYKKAVDKKYKMTKAGLRRCQRLTDV